MRLMSGVFCVIASTDNNFNIRSYSYILRSDAFRWQTNLVLVGTQRCCDAIHFHTLAYIVSNWLPMACNAIQWLWLASLPSTAMRIAQRYWMSNGCPNLVIILMRMCFISRSIVSANNTKAEPNRDNKCD